jgi:hypothetical protein
LGLAGANTVVTIYIIVIDLDRSQLSTKATVNVTSGFKFDCWRTIYQTIVISVEFSVLFKIDFVESGILNCCVKSQAGVSLFFEKGAPFNTSTKSVKSCMVFSVCHKMCLSYCRR